MLRTHDLMQIGEVARRSGLAPSALRHYETLGLIASTRTAGDRRLYQRSVLRRLAVVRAGQRVGLTLEEIRASFGSLAPDKAPTRQQWARISRSWAPSLDRRIRELEQVRDNLAGCIGCGCLSMRQCSLYNPQDTLGEGGGQGAQRLLPQ
ncbi:redox-sensitive transcriptional activator SoxR [Arsenicicoccus bolidensis]|uniref:redox-sensitive transcriptional activator SoxR n=1 Tax=Arsenicicoccus bolidensis TaxID=229480 RepID=UPI000492654B|nr:redox-sensitive transcriptional activator SoxR [Arsenicicoccus bolidensis]